MRINFSGTPTNNEMLLLKAQNRPAAGIRLAFDDPLKVAAANRFRVIENQFNPSGVDASLAETPVRYPQDEALWLPKVVSTSGLETLDNNIVTSEAIRLDQVSASPIAVIPEGYKDVALYLGELNGQDLELQVTTRDGRHLLGRPLADDLIAAEEANLGRALRSDERAALIEQAGINFMTAARLSGVSFAEGASYSTDHLNAPDNQAYRDMELFYGVKAMVQEIRTLNEDHVVGGIARLAASVTSDLVKPFTVELSPTTGRAVIFGPQDFVLNNAPLGALVLERTGVGAQLVMQGQDAMGRPVRTVLDVPLDPPTNNDQLYEIDARHVDAWLRAQPAWGQGERQVLTFGGGAQGGDITVRLAPDQEVTVYGITPYATAAEVAHAVAQAIAEDPYIANVSGRSVQAMDDGSVVIQFATTDIDMPRVSLDTYQTGIEGRVIEETATAGILGRGEVQTYQFSAAQETGVFDIAGARVHVAAGDSSAEVARKVAAALSGEQRVLRFTGAPNIDSTLTVEGVAVQLPASASPDYVAEAVKLALENDATFMAANPSLILSLEPDGQALRFTFPPSDLSPDGIQVSAPAGLTAQVTETSRFVDGADGRRVIHNNDGSITVRYQANEGNPPTLSLTPVTTPWPERQTLTFTGTATAGTLSIADRPVAVDAGDTAAEVARKVQYALESEYQTLVFAGSASGGETLEVQIGHLVIPVKLPGTSNDALTAADVATAVYNVLYPAADPATNMRSGAFFQAYPFTQVTNDSPGTLRIIFDPTTAQVPDVVIRPISATLVSTTLTVAERLEERYRGTSIMPGGEENSLIIRYPATVGDVPDLSIPNAATAGITTALFTSNYREPDPGVSFNATIQSFQGLEIDLLSVYDPFGNPVLNGMNADLPGSQMRFTQTPLGQGEIQTIFFGPSTAAGEIEIGGVKVKIPNGASATDVAMLVRNALEKEYGSSALSASQREFVVNPDGSLSVKAGVGAGNVRDLALTSNGGTGISFRSETVDYLADGQKFESEVRLGFGQTGNSLDLAKLGFRTGVYLSGAVKEDLLVFTTGKSNGFGYSLGATYTEGSRDPIETLRNEPFDVVFTSPTQYRIIDRSSGSVVADRRYDPTLGIVYRGITLSLNGEPLAGDRFAVDGNQDGIGNNANSLRIIELQSSRVLGGANGKTLAEAYSQTVSDVGSMAFQSSIAQKALEVVKDQAVQARDKVSGVSLDEEAADLIRFQQAYQASAKVMQTASVLFDAIIQIR
jgi:hypothetical protein